MCCEKSQHGQFTNFRFHKLGGESDMARVTGILERVKVECLQVVSAALLYSLKREFKPQRTPTEPDPLEHVIR
jgi:hypothetical protein